MRCVRLATEADHGVLAGFLSVEDIPADEMAFHDKPTFVLEEDGVVMGFVTLGLAHGVYPEVVHFVIGRPYRTPQRLRFFMRALRRVVRDAGSPRLIFHACQPHLRRLIEYYFKAEPYALTDERAYYLVRV